MGAWGAEEEEAEQWAGGGVLGAWEAPEVACHVGRGMQACDVGR